MPNELGSNPSGSCKFHFQISFIFVATASQHWFHLVKPGYCLWILLSARINPFPRFSTIIFFLLPSLF
ncbi:Uncharacterized protein TCM_030672 [Theobroma cacao]|uniref:Uncharacterized protein n=1 Tax=Theobroma cacao TaxID=3641 RepID=A0A061F5W0_THECC|nr:Uncharacterized protein TCM_030672 [Theobroma cacao]